MSIWTHTSRGYALDLEDPQPEVISIAEVRDSLANLCRYNGCVGTFYSVAEHSVLVSHALWKAYKDPHLALAGLLHDGHEAYVGDITWPVQQLLFTPEVKARYEVLKGQLDALICEKVRLDVVMLKHPKIKEFDLRILLDERKYLLTEPPPRPWEIETVHGYTPLGVEIKGLHPTAAASAFRGQLEFLQVHR